MFQLGQSQTVFAQYESDSIDVEFGYKKPSHPEILDIELDAAEFNEKWGKWEQDKSILFAELLTVSEPDDDDDTEIATLIARLDDEASKSWLQRLQQLKSQISSDDLKPVYAFISTHIITIDGVLGADGKPVKMWADLDQSARAEIMGAMTPYDVTGFYGDIKRSVMLKVAEKKP